MYNKKTSIFRKIFDFLKMEIEKASTLKFFVFLVGSFKVLVFSLTSFGNSRGNSCTKFVVDIKFPFTCGEPSVFTCASTRHYDKYCLSFFFLTFYISSCESGFRKKHSMCSKLKHF